MKTEVGEKTRILPIGYMSDGTVADMSKGIIAYKSLTPEIISVDEETGEVTALRAGTGRVQVDLLLGTSGAQAIAEVKVIDTSAILSAQFASESMTVGYLRDAELVITGEMASGYAADVDYSNVEWIIECDADGCGEDGHEHVISIDGNMVFGNVFGGKATVKAKVTLNGATVETENALAVEVVKTDLRDYMIDFRETESNDLEIINIETDGWELNREKSHSSAANGYINTSGYTATTNATGRKVVIDAYVPYEGVYQIVFTGQYNGYNARLSDVLLDGVRIGEYSFFNGANASAEPKSLNAVYLSAGVHEFTFNPKIAGTRNSYQTLKMIRFSAKDTDFEAVGVTAENTEYNLYLNDTVNVEARLKAKDGFLYAALSENDPVVDITYTSADENIAKADAMGNVTATGSGSTVITVTAKLKNSEETFTLDIKVNVEGGSIEDYKLLPERTEFYVGEKVKLSVDAKVAGTSLPSDKMTLKFGTSDKSVAAIDGAAMTAKAAGNATITTTITYYNEPPVSFTTDITVKDDGLGSVEIDAPSFVMSPEGNGIFLTARGVSHLGKAVDISGAEVVWEIADGAEFASVDADGHVSPLGVGQALVRVTVTPQSGEPAYGETYVSVRYGKTGRTYYTDEMVAAAQENVNKYKWAQSLKKSAVAQADKYVEQLDALYELIHSEGIPRGNAVGYRNDPDKWHCRYCGKNLYTDYGHYPWRTDVLTRPWKVQCPDCKRLFPSNDFGSFYKLGLDEHGNFDRIRALENHRAMLIEKGFMTDDGASAPKTEYSDEWYTYYGYGVSGGYLCNDTYTELWKDEKASTYNKDPRTGDTIDGRRWGVDDSLGYRPGRSATGSAGEENMEVHTYISVVSHCGIWYSGVGSGISGVVNKALNSLADAYLYTGDEKYGRAGAVLVDRVADVYADYNLRPWLLRFSNSDGGAKRGQIIGSIWETGLQQDFVCAYDAFFPMYDDPQTIELLTEKAKKNNFDGKLIERNGELTVTGETIRQNIEDRLVREVFVSVKDTSSSGNFGMHQSSLAAAAVILDNHPETDEMFDWIFRYGESDNTSYSTGGGVSQRLVDNVFRDGQGNESAFGYNRLWVTQLTDLANTLARYPEYDGMSLYNNPKYIGMIQSYPYVTLVRRGVPAIGDGGGPANYPVLPDEDAVMLDSFKVLRNAEDKVLRDIAVEIAQHMYFVKGGKLSNLHYDVFTKNPESLADEVEEIIEEHGEWNYDKSSMLTGYGLGILRSGTLYDSVGTSVVRDTQRDMWIYFGGSSSHNNDDALSLGIESYGIGMTTDLGYPEATGADPNRAQWQGATLAHNTVVVNEKSQLKSAYSHKPLHYDGKDTRVKVVDVDAATAYTETDEYRRTVVMIDYDDEVSYGLDFFKILGGDDHLYSFHANSENDPEVSENIRNLIKAQVGGSYAGVNVPFGKDPGTVDGSTYGILEYPKGYTWLEDVKRADNPGVGEFWIEYAIDDFRKLSRNGKLDMHLRMTMLNDWKADEISFADGYPPRTPGNLAVMDHLEYMLVRRKGKDLNTLFTTVIEPYNGQRYIKSITGVEIAATGGETPAKTDLAKAVKVELVDGRIDYVVYAQNNKTVYTVTDGDYSFEFCGTVGVWTVRANADGGYDRIYSYLNDGTTLGEGNLKITDADAAISGTVTNFNGMENADEALVFENYIDVKTDITLPAEGEDFDAFAESLADRMFVGEREELGNSAFVIKSVTRIDDEHLRLNLGNISIVDGYKDKKDESLGYIFDVWQGQRFEIPMSYEDNAAPEFTPVDDLTVSAGSSVKVTVSASTENKDGVITYSARTLPRGAGFNADTATFNWKPDSSQIGENLVAIDARDSDGRIATMYFVVTVYGSTTGGTSDKTDGDETTDNSGNSGDTTTPSGGGGGGGGGAAPTPGNTEDGGNQTGNGGESGEAGGNTDNTDTEDEALRFTDVADDVWYHDAATWMGSKGYMSGTAPEKFSPEVATTRAMLVTILYRISGSPETSNEHGFADVEPGSYYEKAVAWAAEHGIVTGHSDTVFAPDELITREQLAAIIYRNEKRLGNDVSHSADLSVFHDGEHVSDWAHEAKSWAVGAGVINGTSETTLHPKKNATRAECATILYRIFGNR
ncbi:MAG: S-layer homology domain-containing protein [Oscillospiraceae bacterium]|nr:S-layer homology domain-containing protein [Oscillospiraceae bacterium]